MNTKSRYAILGIIVLAILTGLALSHGFAWTFAAFGVDDLPLLSRELPLSRLLAFGLAAIAALVVIKSASIFTLATEVVDELSKVTWPSREETGNATVVVLVAVIVCSVYLGVFDAMWLWVTNWVLAVPGSGAG